MNEAIKNLEASQQAHAVEVRSLQENNQLQSKIVYKLSAGKIKVKASEISPKSEYCIQGLSQD
jgi:hypothetical protein